MDSNKVWSWSELNIHTVTNLYLYGDDKTPRNYVDRLRSKAVYDSLPLDGQGEKHLIIKVDAQSFMGSGPGKYVSPSQAPVVQQFFDGLLTLGQGTHTKAQLMQPPYGISEDDFKISMAQYYMDTDSSDYAFRTYVFNNGGFILSNDTEFNVDANGNVSMSNIKIRPFHDNFDFETDGLLQSIADHIVLENEIDPYGIGVKLTFEFVNLENILPINSYDYIADYQTYEDNKSNEILAYVSAYTALQDVVDVLNNARTIEYSTKNGGKIIYGSHGSESLAGTNFDDIVVAGDGADSISTGIGKNVLYGGKGSDSYQIDASGKTWIYEARDSQDAGNSDSVSFSGIDPETLRYEMAGNDLRVYTGCEATEPFLVIVNHFNGNQVESISANFGGSTTSIDLRAVVISPCKEEKDDVSKEALDAGTQADAGKGRGSPLILDLDHSGGINLVSLENSNAYFDRDQDGFAEWSGIAASSDGYLALDLNENGRIDDNGELFGTVDRDGFTILSQYDSNGDGKISSEDLVWGDLIIWQDHNENGFSEDGETYGLSDFDIVSIDLNATEVSQTNQGHDVTHTSTFTVDDGVSGPQNYAIHDVWFEYDNLNTHFVGEYDASETYASFIDLRGYGKLPDISIATALDNENEGNITALLADMLSKEFSDIFNGTTDTLDSIRDIMFRWAGVDEVVAGSRGNHIDARELEFLEEFLGEEWFQNGTRPNPGPEASWNLERAFNIMLNSTFARIVGQMVGDDLFEGDWHYNISTDKIEGITGLNIDTIDDLEISASALATTAEKEIFWQNVVRVVEFNIGYDNLSSGDKTALNSAIVATDSSLNLLDMISSLDVLETQYGQDGNDIIQGDGYTNDTLFGYAGNDRLEGMDGDDQLTGGTGDDYLLGSFGNDKYYYNVGDGFDTIREQSNSTGNTDDRIVFGAGITIDDLTFTRVGDTDLMIDIDTGSYVGQIFIENHFNYSSGGGHVELLEFSDSSTYRLDDKAYITYGTGLSDKIYGSRSGGSGVDTIYGGAGNDTIMGYAPNQSDPNANWLYGEDGHDKIYGGNGVDTIEGGAGDDYVEGNSGADIITGGTGNDTLKGGFGSDVYYYALGDGNDTIQEDGKGSGDLADELRFGAGITVNDLTFTRTADNKLLIDIDTGTETARITILTQFNNSSGGPGYLETIRFSDNSTLDLTTMNYITIGTSGNDSFYGISLGGGASDILYGGAGDDVIRGYAPNQTDFSANTLYGEDGNDSLYGGRGNDTIYGGSGNDHIEDDTGDDVFYGGTGDDRIEGGAGSDIYYYNLGDGNDVIEESGTGSDKIVFGAGITAGDLTFVRDANDTVTITIASSNTIALEGQTTSTGTVLETLEFADTSTLALSTINYTTYGTSAGETIRGVRYGGGFSDTIYAGAGNDIIYAYAPNQTDTAANWLYGEDGNDTIYGGSGADHFEGGAGNDELRGGAGNDTYVYNLGDGDDLVVESGSGTADKLIFGSGITVNDLSFSRNKDGNVMIAVAGSGIITIDSQTASANSVLETLQFADTSTLDMTTVNLTTYGTSANDTINGARYGAGFSDTIYGGAGNDTIYGYGSGQTDTAANWLYGEDGNDTIYGGSGNDLLDGGSGDDDLRGGVGNDRYVYTSGLDIVTDTGGTDTLYLGNGITVDDISFSNVSTYNTKITIDAGVDEITVVNLRHTNANNRVDFIEFEDGFTTTLPNYASWISGTISNDTSLNGTSGVDTILGLAGDDTINAGNGADNVHGGAGNDTLYGDAGDDLLHGGIGNDTLYGGDGLDTLFGGAGADTFVFENATAFNNVDVIKDFNTGHGDILDLSDLLGGFDPLTDAITDFVQITESAGNSALFVDRDGAGGTYGLQQIATIQGVTGLTDEAALYSNGTLLAA